MKYNISKVSPRPWTIHGPLILSGRSYIDRQTACGNPDAEAQWARDAAHIVHCVNHHEALVEALGRAIKSLPVAGDVDSNGYVEVQYSSGEWDDAVSVSCEARALLEKAKA